MKFEREDIKKLLTFLSDYYDDTVKEYLTKRINPDNLSLPLKDLLNLLNSIPDYQQLKEFQSLNDNILHEQRLDLRYKQNLNDNLFLEDNHKMIIKELNELMSENIDADSDLNELILLGILYKDLDGVEEILKKMRAEGNYPSGFYRIMKYILERNNWEDDLDFYLD